MKKFKKQIIILVVIISFSINNMSINAEILPLDRNILGEYVSTIAKQFLYKNTYTDYEQYAMDDSETRIFGSTFLFREAYFPIGNLNRNKTYVADCSSFVTNIYINALGYSFSDYYEQSTGYFLDYYSLLYNKLKDNQNTYINSIMATGKGSSTKMFENIAKTEIGELETETIYTNEDSKKMVPFYYNISNLETETKREEVYLKFKEILKNGDIFVIRYEKDNSNAGHAMLYVDDYIDSTGNTIKGFIHSTGIDYDFSNPTKGNDEYSVRFMSYEDFENYSTQYDTIKNIGYLFSNRGNKTPISIMILRPINKVLNKEYTNFYDNTYGSTITDDNLIALNNLSTLSFEEYITLVIDGKETNFSEHNSVNNNEKLKFNLYIKNTSNQNINIKINDILPKNTTFVECDNKCDFNDNKINWNNIEVKANEEKKLSYTIEINATKNNSIIKEGMNIISPNNNTLVMASQKILINNTYRNTEKTKLLDEIEKIKLNNQNSFENFKLLYKNILDIDLPINDNYMSILFKEVCKDNKCDGYIKNIDSKDNLNSILLPGVYGGRKVRGNPDNNRINNIELTNLEIGDIIIMGELKNSYLYMGLNNQNNPEIIDTKLNTSSGNEAINTFRSIYTYDNFIILRPSLLEKNNNINPEDNNKKDNILSNPQTGNCYLIIIITLIISLIGIFILKKEVIKNK